MISRNFCFPKQENSRGKFHSSSEVPSNINTTTTCKQTAENTNTNTDKIANTEAIGTGNTVTKEHNKDHGVPSQIAVPHLSSTAPGSAAR